MPADGGGIEQDVRALHGSEARRFRIPLVPTHQHAQTAELGVEVFEAQVAGCEVEFLEEKRVIGNVHLAVEAQQVAVRTQYRCRVVIEPGRPAFKQRRDNHHSVFPRDFAQAFGGRARHRLCKIEQFGLLFAAKILRAVELGKADDLRAGLRGLNDFLLRFLLVLAGVQ